MRNSGSNVHLRKISKFDNFDLQMLNVIRSGSLAPIVPRSTAQHPLTTKPISNPSLSSLDQRPLTFHHPNSFHSKCKGPNQQIPSARNEEYSNQTNNHHLLSQKKKQRSCRIFYACKCERDTKLPYDDCLLNCSKSSSKKYAN